MISGFRCEVVENRALLGCYAASSGNLKHFVIQQMHKYIIRRYN